MTRCTEGCQLWAAIDEALATHNPERIYAALRCYFQHKFLCVKGCNPLLVIAWKKAK